MNKTTSAYTEFLNNLCGQNLMERLKVIAEGGMICPILAPAPFNLMPFFKALATDVSYDEQSFAATVIKAKRVSASCSPIQQIYSSFKRNFILESDEAIEVKILHELQNCNMRLIMISRGDRWTNAEWDRILQMREFFNEEKQYYCGMLLGLSGGGEGILKRIPAIGDSCVKPISFFNQKYDSKVWIEKIWEEEFLMSATMDEMGRARLKNCCLLLKNHCRENLALALRIIQFLKHRDSQNITMDSVAALLKHFPEAISA